MLYNRQLTQILNYNAFRHVKNTVQTRICIYILSGCWKKSLFSIKGLCGRMITKINILQNVQYSLKAPSLDLKPYPRAPFQDPSKLTCVSALVQQLPSPPRRSVASTLCFANIIS